MTRPFGRGATSHDTTELPIVGSLSRPRRHDWRTSLCSPRHRPLRSQRHVEVEGTLTGLDFVNPHSYVYFNAVGAAGAVIENTLHPENEDWALP
jgi:hypothetical protein